MVVDRAGVSVENWLVDVVNIPMTDFAVWVLLNLEVSVEWEEEPIPT